MLLPVQITFHGIGHSDPVEQYVRSKAAKLASTWPGPFGLYDMAGNVWEWTASPYCPNDNPSCGDKRRVVRAGSWVMVDYLFVRLTDRAASDPFTRNTNLGFRCVRP